jgi:hypothetical protein
VIYLYFLVTKIDSLLQFIHHLHETEEVSISNNLNSEHDISLILSQENKDLSQKLQKLKDKKKKIDISKFNETFNDAVQKCEEGIKAIDEMKNLHDEIDPEFTLNCDLNIQNFKKEKEQLLWVKENLQNFNKEPKKERFNADENSQNKSEISSIKNKTIEFGKALMKYSHMSSQKNSDQNIVPTDDPNKFNIKQQESKTFVMNENNDSQPIIKIEKTQNEENVIKTEEIITPLAKQVDEAIQKGIETFNKCHRQKDQQKRKLKKKEDKKLKKKIKNETDDINADASICLEPFWENLEENFDKTVLQFRNDLLFYEDTNPEMVLKVLKILQYLEHTETFKADQTKKLEFGLLLHGALRFVKAHVTKIQKDGIDPAVFTIKPKYEFLWKTEAMEKYLLFLTHLFEDQLIYITNYVNDNLDENVGKKCRALVIAMNGSMSQIDKTEKYDKYKSYRYEYFVIQIGYIFFGARENYQWLQKVLNECHHLKK